MKQFFSFLALVLIITVASCSQGKPGNNDGNRKKSHQADTGYTGTDVYKSNGVVRKTVELKNGVKDGITRTYYKGGALEQEMPYVEGSKNGLAKWYYPDGKVFRTTPYVNDTIDGDQIQYYKNDRKRAIISYKAGLRVPVVHEYLQDGTKIIDYPHPVYRVEDLYKEKGVYKIFVEMSDKAEDAVYYRGDFVNGLVDLTACEQLQQTATTGYLNLQKSEGASADSVVVIAGYLTPSGNRYYMRMAIPLPYKDLK